MILDDYIAEVNAAIYDLPGGALPPFPETAEQLLWLNDHFPEWARRYRPNDDVIRYMGLSRYVGRDVPPWHIEAKEELLATLASDSNFAKAVGMLIRGAA